MNQHVEKLSDEALAMLRAGDVDDPPPDVEARVLSRLRTELPPVIAPRAAAPQPTPLGRYGAPLSLVTLVVGVALGVLWRDATAEPWVEVRTVEVQVPAPANPTPVAVAVEPEPVAPVKRPVVVAAKPPAPKDSPDLALAAERQLIEQARNALVRGEARAAEAPLSDHAARFPRGRLAEERESLWIQALLRQGRFPDARTRATNFERDFPNSLLLPAVEAAMKSIPSK